MTIDEAIEIETIHNDHNPNFTDAEREEAHQLGIEALKRLKGYQDHTISITLEPLPGETKAPKKWSGPTRLEEELNIQDEAEKRRRGKQRRVKSNKG